MKALVCSMVLVTLLLAGCSSGATDSIVSTREAPTSDLEIYLEQVGAITKDVSLGDSASLMTEANYLDPAVVAIFLARSTRFGDAFEQLAEITPPAEAQELHLAVLNALVTCEQALTASAQFLHGDGDFYGDQATGLYRECGDHFDAAASLLDEVRA